MSFQQMYNDAHDEGLQQRVRVALMQYAATVATEDPTTANHANRVAMIDKLIGNLDFYSDLYALAIASNAGITTASLDSDILTSVGNAWSAFAGQV